MVIARPSGRRRDPLLAELPARGWCCGSRGRCRPTRTSTSSCTTWSRALAIGEGIPTPAVYVIDDPSPNAFATGVSPEKAAITYTTGLLAIMNREELEGVTGHEMSHIKNHDIRLLLIVGTMIGMAALLASILWRGAFFRRRAARAQQRQQLVHRASSSPGCCLADRRLHLRPADSPGALAPPRVAGRRQRCGAHPQPGRAAERAEEAAAERQAVQEA